MDCRIKSANDEEKNDDDEIKEVERRQTHLS
jgi:hypothetical protein